MYVYTHTRVREMFFLTSSYCRFPPTDILLKRDRKPRIPRFPYNLENYVNFYYPPNRNCSDKEEILLAARLKIAQVSCRYNLSAISLDVTDQSSWDFYFASSPVFSLKLSNLSVKLRRRIIR